MNDFRQSVRRFMAAEVLPSLDEEVERQYRDQKILAIGGGTTEILTTLAATRLGFTA